MSIEFFFNSLSDKSRFLSDKSSRVDKKFNTNYFSKYSEILLLDNEIHEQNNFYVLPLSEAISAPLVFRNTHYRNVFSNRSSKWSILIGRLLKEGEKLVQSELGKYAAEEWYYSKKYSIQELALSGNYSRILFDDRGNGVTQIRQIEDPSNISYFIDELIIRLPNNKSIIIASREFKNRSDIEKLESKLDGFSLEAEHKSNFFNSLKQIHGLGIDVFLKHHHYVFCHSDDTIKQYKQFFSEIIENYMIDSVDAKTQSSNVLIVFDLNMCESNTFTNIENLALGRIDYTKGWILCRKDIKFDNLMKLISKRGIVTEHINSEQILRLEDQTMPDANYVAMIFPCDVFSWRSSVIIDGEQVMTVN